MCGDLDDFDGSELSRGWVRARKAHACFAVACDVPIRPGDRYHRTVTTESRGIQTFRHCARCWLICEALWSAGVEAVQWDLNCGEVWDDPPDDVAALAFLTADEAQGELR